MGRKEKPHEKVGPPGDMIYKLREENKWTDDQLVKKSGLSIATINRMKNGNQGYSTVSLRKIAKAFGVPIFVLLIDPDEYADDLIREITRLPKNEHDLTRTFLAGQKLLREKLKKDND